MLQGVISAVGVVIGAVRGVSDNVGVCEILNNMGLNRK